MMDIWFALTVLVYVIIGLICFSAFLWITLAIMAGIKARKFKRNFEREFNETRDRINRNRRGL